MKTLLAVLTLSVLFFAGLAGAEEKKEEKYPIAQCHKAFVDGKAAHVRLREIVKYLGDKIAEGDKNKMYRNLSETREALSNASSSRALLSDYSRMLEQKASEWYRYGEKLGESESKISEKQYDELMDLVKRMRAVFGPLPKPTTKIEYEYSLLSKEEREIVEKAQEILKE